MNNLTLNDIKRNNYSLIYRYIYNNRKTSKQDIANNLHLSLPTVTQNLLLLEKEGFIEKSGQFESQIGRKATAYCFNEKSRISIGVEILNKTVCIVAVDLFGCIFKKLTLSLDYSNVSSYYIILSNEIINFITSLDISNDNILGIGFGVQALTSSDGSKITYGEILNCTGVKIDVFSMYLPYPCMFFHDAGCAATSELWIDEQINNSVYLSIGKHLGGAIIINREILLGDQGHSGAVEHITLIPNGKKCYCNKLGCMECYCSVNSLLNETETLNDFFINLRNKSISHAKRWNDYLEYLSLAISNLHLLINNDFILGGHISSYLIDDDISLLHKKVNDKTTFPTVGNFIRISTVREDSIPLGSALPYIKKYLNSI